jgi:hypothetical protein
LNLQAIVPVFRAQVEPPSRKTKIDGKRSLT